MKEVTFEKEKQKKNKIPLFYPTEEAFFNRDLRSKNM